MVSLDRGRAENFDRLDTAYPEHDVGKPAA
jgi:hypothetical protein